MTMAPDQLLDSLRWRYATKHFDPAREIPGETWDALEKSLVLTPSSFGLQPWKFLVVLDREIRRDLAAASWGQAQVTQASHYVVLTARTEIDSGDIDAWIDRLSEVQGTPLEKFAPLRSVIEAFILPMEREVLSGWNARQVYIALGQFMAAAAVIGVDTCPMEGLDPARYDDILGLEGSGYTTVVACAAGYRADHDKSAKMPKVRFAADRVITRIG